MDDSNSANKYSLCICVKTTFFHLISESLKVIIKGKVYMVRAKEVIGWVLEFKEENSDESEDYSDNNSVGKKNWVEYEEDHYEYEKVEALRESTTPQDPKKVRNDQTFHQGLEESVNKSSGVSKTAHADSMAGPVKQRNGGYSFTWSDKHASKMSKLDWFLVSQGMLDLFPNLTGLILHRHLSDHRPILLKETHVDYGPTPFRLYHSWFLEDDFHSVIEDSWNNDGIFVSNSMILLKNKLDFLKQRLKEWSSIKRRNKDHDRKVIQDSLIEIDLRLDKGNGLPDDLTKRVNLFRDLKDVDHKDSIDLAQKAKIKWAVEGDEKSKNFHGIVNKKRRHLAIKGILVDGEWIENPNRVKSEFYSYYSNLFSAPAWDRSLFDVNFPRRLNSDQVFDLEDMVSNEEIKRVV
nr:RNA-directed DNA polymerase, eukaryota [Tanacetum cinerariifolium]